MSKEIEHKYLVTDDSYLSMATGSANIMQGYLNTDPMRTVRVRTIDDKAFITIKGITEGDTRQEFEYPVPFDDAQELLLLSATPVIRKRRYYVPFKNKIWEVDKFEGDLYPLAIAEIELTDSNEKYELPPFVGQNITGDPRYYNSVLAGLEPVS